MSPSVPNGTGRKLVVVLDLKMGVQWATAMAVK